MENINAFQIFSVAAILSYFIPIMIVLIKGLWRDSFFMLFASYWVGGGLVNLTDVIPGFSETALEMISIIYNMLDIPIMLALLHFTTASTLIKKYTSLAFFAIVGFELLVALVNGINYDTIKYTLGYGIALVLVVIIWEIIRFLQKIEHTNRQRAKIFIYAALLFEYGSFVVIYIFDYFIVNEYVRDSYLIYYTSSLVAILIASCGYLLIRINKNKGQKYYQMRNNAE